MITQSTREFRLPSFKGGLNLRDLENKIDDDQSPDMMNVWFRDRVLSKRWGQEHIILKDASNNTVTLGTIRGISSEYEGFKCIHAGIKLYKWDEQNNIAEVLKDSNSIEVSVADADGFFLEFNGLLYHCDGSELRQISTGYTCTAVKPHAPVVYINCKPDLSGSDANDAFNLIGSGFEMWYNGDGTGKEYKLCATPMLPLDNTAIKVVINGEEKTDFTFNYQTGVVTFNTAPPAGTNNVRITAYKTQKEKDSEIPVKSRITGCRAAIAYGGESTDIDGGSRAFLMRNAAYPQTYWYSDLGSAQGQGMAYFPDNQYEDLIQNNEAITAAAKQAGELIIFKERSIFAINYSFDGQDVYYPVREFSSSIGCDVPKSVQLVDNSLVFCNTSGGVFMILSTSGKAEEIVKPISANINGLKDRPGLLNEAGLKYAVSIDFDRKYWLCVNGICYIWDYGMTPYSAYTDYEKAQRRLTWYRFNNINAACWTGGLKKCVYALNNENQHTLVRFTDSFRDFSNAISCWWKSKAFDFASSDMLKTFLYVNPSLSTETDSSTTFTVSNEKEEGFFTRELTVSNFNWRNFMWDKFAFEVVRYAKAFKVKVKMKKATTCQLKFMNAEDGRDMGITDISIYYSVNKMVKG